MSLIFFPFRVYQRREAPRNGKGRKQDVTPARLSSQLRVA